MPNWCENIIQINGTKEDLCNFITKHIDDEGDLDFNTIIPEPNNIDECDPQYIYSDETRMKLQLDCSKPWFNWYSWHVNNWGSKWNAVDTYAPSVEDINKNDLTGINICFNTAWSPVEPIVLKLQEMYPDLEITYAYYECGMCFAGYIDEQGIITNLNYDWTDPEFTKFLNEFGFESDEYIKERIAEETEEEVEEIE